MKSDTEILNEAAHKSQILRCLTDVESQELKLRLMDIHNYLISVCDKYGLTIMMGGGSCLGAIRHKGFIPWDDDLDLMMPRADYNQLISLFEKGQIDEKYHFEYPNKEKDVKNPFLKVFLKGTRYVDAFDDNDHFPSNIYVDIFSMDFAPNNLIIRKIKAIISDSLQFICTCTLYSQYPSNNLRNLYNQDKESLRRYKVRLALGKLFSFLPHYKWIYLFDNFNAKSKKSDNVTIPTGRNHYFKETQPKYIFLPVKKVPFENTFSYVANDYHTYLTKLYGDYMKIPPLEKRERHFIVEFKL